jgi:hypothetical protein
MLWRRGSVQMALSATAAAVLFLSTGVAGYTLSRHDRFVAGTPWSPTVIWSQVLIGVACVAVAAYYWRVGLRDLRRPRPYEEAIPENATSRSA